MSTVGYRQTGGKEKRILKCEMDLMPNTIREAQRAEVYLRTVMDLLNAGMEKLPWATVEGADLEVQQLHAQRETLQLQDDISADAIASALACGAYGRSHGSQKDTGSGNEDGLLEGLKGRCGAVL